MLPFCPLIILVLLSGRWKFFQHSHQMLFSPLIFHSQKTARGFEERAEGDFSELGRGTRGLQIFFWVVYLIIYFLLDQLNLRGLARNQLLPGHLSHSDFSAPLPLADLPASQRASVQVSPGPVSWRTRLCTFKIAFCVGTDWERLIHLKNCGLSHGYFLCQPKGRLGESFSFLTGLVQYSSTKSRGRIFKVNTVKLISFSDPLSTPFPLPISHQSLICHFFFLSRFIPFTITSTLVTQWIN